MAMETDLAFLNHPMDLSTDGSFPDFTTQFDSRPHAFDHTLAGKPSPGTPSQFLLTPSSLWDRTSFDDSAVDIFADFPDAPAPEHQEQESEVALGHVLQQLPEQDPKQVVNSASQPIKIKEESPAPAVAPQTTRRLTRGTSSGSIVRNSSGTDKVASKVKKPRAPAKRTTKRAKGPAKVSPKEEEIEQAAARIDETRLSEDLLPGEDDVRRNKFLERNRVAASKCRQKKKQWMHSLEETKNDLEKTHKALREELNALAGELGILKEHLMTHANCGDQNIDSWFTSEARRFVESKTREDEARRQSTSSGSGETQQSSRSSVVQGSPTSSIAPPVAASPTVKEETFSYDYMPDDMFADA